MIETLIILTFLSIYGFVCFRGGRAHGISTAAKALKKPTQPALEGKRYGHPAPVLASIEQALPRPPTGHMWELSIIANEKYGNPTAKVVLMNILTNTEVASKERDLVYESAFPHIDEYSYFTERYSNRSDNIRMDYFKHSVVTPFKAWAEAQKNKYQSYNVEPEFRVKG